MNAFCFICCLCLSVSVSVCLQLHINTIDLTFMKIFTMYKRISGQGRRHYILVAKNAKKIVTLATRHGLQLAAQGWRTVDANRVAAPQTPASSRTSTTTHASGRQSERITGCPGEDLWSPSVLVTCAP